RQTRPNKGTTRKIEGMTQFFLKDLLDGSLLAGCLQLVQILERQRHGQLRRNDLHILTVDVGEGRAQNFVASHDLVDASLQDRRVDRRRQSEHVDGVEKRHVRQRVL